MSTAPNPKILNLDDLETPESDVKVVHKGVSHSMRVLSVEMFIAQQRRATEHQRMATQKAEAGEGVDEGDIAGVVELLRDSVVEFFPTLPVNELPTQKLFLIFGWLNEMSAKINEVGTDVVEAAASAEGNDPAPAEVTES